MRHASSAFPLATGVPFPPRYGSGHPKNLLSMIHYQKYIYGIKVSKNKCYLILNKASLLWPRATQVGTKPMTGLLTGMVARPRACGLTCVDPSMHTSAHSNTTFHGLGRNWKYSNNSLRHTSIGRVF